MMTTTTKTKKRGQSCDDDDDDDALETACSSLTSSSSSSKTNEDAATCSSLWSSCSCSSSSSSSWSPPFRRPWLVNQYHNEHADNNSQQEHVMTREEEEEEVVAIVVTKERCIKDRTKSIYDDDDDYCNYDGTDLIMLDDTDLLMFGDGGSRKQHGEFLLEDDEEKKDDQNDDLHVILLDTITTDYDKYELEGEEDDCGKYALEDDDPDADDYTDDDADDDGMVLLNDISTSRANCSYGTMEFWFVPQRRHQQRHCFRNAILRRRLMHLHKDDNDDVLDPTSYKWTNFLLFLENDDDDDNSTIVETIIDDNRIDNIAIDYSDCDGNNEDEAESAAEPEPEPEPVSETAAGARECEDSSIVVGVDGRVDAVVTVDDDTGINDDEYSKYDNEEETLSLSIVDSIANEHARSNYCYTYYNDHHHDQYYRTDENTNDRSNDYNMGDDRCYRFYYVRQDIPWRELVTTSTTSTKETDSDGDDDDDDSQVQVHHHPLLQQINYSYPERTKTLFLSSLSSSSSSPIIIKRRRGVANDNINEDDNLDDDDKKETKKKTTTTTTAPIDDGGEKMLQINSNSNSSMVCLNGLAFLHNSQTMATTRTRTKALLDDNNVDDEKMTTTTAQFIDDGEKIRIGIACLNELAFVQHEPPSTTSWISCCDKPSWIQPSTTTTAIITAVSQETKGNHASSAVPKLNDDNGGIRVTKVVSKTVRSMIGRMIIKMQNDVYGCVYRTPMKRRRRQQHDNDGD